MYLCISLTFQISVYCPNVQDSVNKVTLLSIGVNVKVKCCLVSEQFLTVYSCIYLLNALFTENIIPIKVDHHIGDIDDTAAGEDGEAQHSTESKRHKYNKCVKKFSYQ